MFVYYGTKGTHRLTAAVPGVACPACGTPNALRASVYSRYAHIYFIPFFPIGKPALAQCEHCQQVFEEKDMPADSLRPAVQTLKAQTKHPIWAWLGAVAIAGLVVMGIVNGARDTRENQAYLQAPRAGDVYTVRQDSSGTAQYSLLKVQSVSGNSVELVQNQYVTNSSHPIDNLNEPSRYSAEPFTLTRFDLQIMQQKGQITDVDRP